MWSHDTDLPIKAEVRAFIVAVGKRLFLSDGLAPWQNESLGLPGHLCHHLGDIRGSLNKTDLTVGRDSILLIYFEPLDLLKPAVNPWTFP